MINMSALTADDLPQSLIDVVEAVGLAAALALVEHAGGTRVYIPAQIDADHLVTQWLGEADAAAISEHFGGEVLAVPRCLVAMRNVRDRQIRAQRKDGARINDLALQYRLTDRQVYTILASGDEIDTRQQSLL